MDSHISLKPGLAYTRINQRCFTARISTHDKTDIRLLNSGYGRIKKVMPTLSFIYTRSIDAAIAAFIDIRAWVRMGLPGNSESPARLMPW